MYQRCLFCRSRLGRNETVEAFQIGRRLAFDQAKGRLWVVCSACFRWNLTPLEERWEAIDQCERTFRDIPLRKSTDNIGLARAKDGTDLIRIGHPLLPEFAAWRYQNRLVRRYRVAQGLIFAGLAAQLGQVTLQITKAAGALAAFSIPPAALVVSSTLLLGVYAAQFAQRHRLAGGRHTRVVVPGSKEELLVRATDAGNVRVLPVGKADWKLRLPHKHGVAEFAGPSAVFAAGRVLPRMTYMASSKKVVLEASERVIALGGPDAVFAAIARENRWGMILNPVSLVAAEISANESSESEYLTEHLRLLETQWRDAENIAAIADDLLVPETVNRKLGELRDAANRPDRQFGP